MRKIECEDCPSRTKGNVCDLPLETLGDLRQGGVTAVYRPRQVLFSEGNPADGLYLVCQGSVKLFQSDRFGRERILETAGPGSIVGELSAEGEFPQSVSAEATETSQICFLPQPHLLALIREHPDVGMHLIEALGRQLAMARRKVRDLQFKGAASRLAGALLSLAEASAEDGAVLLRLPYSRAELAQTIGVSTETAIRLLTKLARKGTIEVDGRSVMVPDIQRLRRLARSDELDE